MNSIQTNQVVMQSIFSLSAVEQVLLERKLFDSIPCPTVQNLMNLADKGGAFDLALNFVRVCAHKSEGA